MAASAPYTRLPQSPPHYDLPMFFDEKGSPRQASLHDVLISVWSRRRASFRRLLKGLTLAGCVLLVVQVSSSPVVSEMGGRGVSWNSLRSKHLAREKRRVDFETSEVPEEWRCNPFKAAGRLLVDTREPVSSERGSREAGPELRTCSQTNNLWKPFDEGCLPSSLMTGLYVPNSSVAPINSPSSGPLRTNDASVRNDDQLAEQPARPHYPWLVNATILLQGVFLSLSSHENLANGGLVQGTRWNGFTSTTSATSSAESSPTSSPPTPPRLQSTASSFRRFWDRMGSRLHSL